MRQISLSITSPPQTEPITLEEAKAHLRVEIEFEDDDAYINALIKAARRYTEEHSQNLFMHQHWKMSLDGFPCDYAEIIIPKRAVSEVDSIEYIDESGIRQTLSPLKYQVDVDGFLSRIRPAYNETWPYARCQLNAVEIRFTAGYEDLPGGIPEHLKQALLLLIGHFYENREDTVAGVSMQHLPRGYEALVGIERVQGV